jgi:hypothetical protein
MEGEPMSLAERKAELARVRDQAAKELAKLEALPDFEELAEGSIVALTVTYGPSRPYPMVAFKSGGNWFLTGKNSPNKISSDELAGWFATGGRRLKSAAVVAEFTVETAPVFDIGEAMLAAMSEFRPVGYSSDYDESSGRGW